MKRQILSFLLISAVILAFSACSEPLEFDKATGVITFSLARSAFGSTDDVERTTNTIKLAGPAGETRTLTADKQNTSVRVKAGTWNIEVTAALEGWTYAAGAAAVEVIAGQSTTARIVMAEAKFQVTFELNGGTLTGAATASVSYSDRFSDSAAGNKPIPEAKPPSASPAAANPFRGWYIDDGTFAKPFTVNTPITCNITVYADYGYRVGDTGPGGGIVFYRDDKGFTIGGTPSTDCYYLEAAPAGWNTNTPSNDPMLAWASDDTTNPAYENVGSTGMNIGDGKKNTALIIDAAAGTGGTPAASACDSFMTTVNGTPVNDWFLPSVLELDALYQQRSLSGLNLSGGKYWSSVQSIPDNIAAGYDFGIGGAINIPKTEPHYVRPIRAF